MVVKGDHLQLVPKGTYRLAPHSILTLALTSFMVGEIVSRYLRLYLRNCIGPISKKATIIIFYLTNF